MIRLTEIYETPIHSKRAISFAQLKSLEPNFANALQDYFESADNADQEFGPSLLGKDVLGMMVFKALPNGSWEAWPTDNRWYSGVIVWDPKKKEFGNSGYVSDAWLDQATGVKNWRDNTIEPGNVPPPDYYKP